MGDLTGLENNLKNVQPKEDSRIKEALTKNCRWCGHLFIIKTPNQHYCCEKCRKEGYREKNRLRQQKFYKTYGKDRYKKKPLNPGATGLGPHAETNSKLEYKKIQREFKRLNLNKLP